MRRRIAVQRLQHDRGGRQRTTLCAGSVQADCDQEKAFICPLSGTSGKASE